MNLNHNGLSMNCGPKSLEIPFACVQAELWEGEGQPSIQWLHSLRLTSYLFLKEESIPQPSCAIWWKLRPVTLKKVSYVLTVTAAFIELVWCPTYSFSFLWKRRKQIKHANNLGFSSSDSSILKVSWRFWWTVFTRQVQDASHPQHLMFPFLTKWKTEHPC